MKSVRKPCGLLVATAAMLLLAACGGGTVPLAPPDSDGDGLVDFHDNCRHIANADQADADQDGVGNVCDICPSAANADQADTDHDGVGDACDNCPALTNSTQADTDLDGIGNACDNCPTAVNADQVDTDEDTSGDACDNCPALENPDQADADADAVGDLCDNCPAAANTNQLDLDGDSLGNACDFPDLTVDETRAGDSARVVWKFFQAGDCAVQQQCVAAAGWRRLLRFDTFAANLGTNDLNLGAPASTPGVFEFDACHGYYRYPGFVAYSLLDSLGMPVASARQQAMCVRDNNQARFGPGTTPGPVFQDCDAAGQNVQGISKDWADRHDQSADCQWVDVTDINPGDYSLQIEVNPNRAITELSYDDNAKRTAVKNPDNILVSATAGCDRRLAGQRDCGWVNVETVNCTPGNTIEAGCGSSCGLGSCTGDPMMRVCPDNGACTTRFELAFGDDNCGGGCPKTTFICPASGTYTRMTAPYRDGEAYSCTIVTTSTPP